MNQKQNNKNWELKDKLQKCLRMIDTLKANAIVDDNSRGHELLEQLELEVTDIRKKIKTITPFVVLIGGCLL